MLLGICFNPQRLSHYRIIIDIYLLYYTENKIKILSTSFSFIMSTIPRRRAPFCKVLYLHSQMVLYSGVFFLSTEIYKNKLNGKNEHTN